MVTAVIGGTGLYSIEGLEITDRKQVATPFGPPSAPITLGRIAGREVAFLPRHGEHHQFLPSEINFRANIWALKSVGAREVVAVSAVGSLRREIAPGDLALPTQYLDWTRGRRASTFFGEGLSAHISTAEPTCGRLGARLLSAAGKRGEKLHPSATYACVEGPRLGTRAESHFLRGAGCDLVGMTNVPEAFLAREAQLCYAVIAVATDYDCWLDDPAQHVTLEQVMATYRRSLGRVKELIVEALKAAPESDGKEPACGCRRAIENAFLSDLTRLPKDKKELVEFLRS